MNALEKSSVSVRFCSLSELRKAGSITRWVDEFRDELTAVCFNNEVRVWSSVCLHFGGEFHVDCKTGEMRCKWHDWCFDVEDGVLKNRNLKMKLRQYEFVEEGNYLVISAR